MKILILGGTSEARELAERLVARGHQVTTSLAGRTRMPHLPAGTLRVGRFGGAAGLAAYLRSERFEHIIDATHPYAGTISANAASAADESGIPLIRLQRPAWDEPEGAGWVHVATLADAAAALPRGAIVLVTTGHEGLEAMLARTDCRLLVRLIEPPGAPLPGHARLILDRPPYAPEAELALLRTEGVTHLVTKNSGGTQTAAKLQAAREAGVQVIMLERPDTGAAHEVSSVDAAIAALD